MANELVPVNDVERTSWHLQKSGFFKDLRSLSQGVTKIILGRALGLDAASAVMGLFVSAQGKLTLSANLMARCIKAYRDPISGHQKYKYRIKEHTDKVCSIQVWEWTEQAEGKWAWEEVGPPVKVAIEQFKHLAGNPTWKTYPYNMLFARAISNVAKFHTADVFGGSAVYTPDEIPNSGIEVDGETLEVSSVKPVEPVVLEAEVEVVEPNPAILKFYAGKLDILMKKTGETFEKLAPMLQTTSENLKVLASTEEGAQRLVTLLEKRGNAK